MHAERMAAAIESLFAPLNRQLAVALASITLDRPADPAHHQEHGASDRA